MESEFCLNWSGTTVIKIQSLYLKPQATEIPGKPSTWLMNTSWGAQILYFHFCHTVSVFDLPIREARWKSKNLPVFALYLHVTRCQWLLHLISCNIQDWFLDRKPLILFKIRRGKRRMTFPAVVILSQRLKTMKCMTCEVLGKRGNQSPCKETGGKQSVLRQRNEGIHMMCICWRDGANRFLWKNDEFPEPLVWKRGGLRRIHKIH